MLHMSTTRRIFSSTSFTIITAHDSPFSLSGIPSSFVSHATLLHCALSSVFLQYVPLNKSQSSAFSYLFPQESNQNTSSPPSIHPFFSFAVHVVFSAELEQ